MSKLSLTSINNRMANWSVHSRVTWILDNLPETQVLSSSFGAQSVVMLHIMVKQQPNIPIIFVDTGYLFNETRMFAKKLKEQLNLNLHTYKPKIKKDVFELQYGKLWEKGLEGIELYNQIHKVEPFQRALSELNVKTWFSGIRKEQSSVRQQKTSLN